MSNKISCDTFVSLKQVRTKLTENLWQNYKAHTPHALLLETELIKRNETPVLDHYAIIDLPGIYSRMIILAEAFSAIGYQLQGQDYLAEKQNDFLWMAEEDATDQEASEVLPQVVLADFRPHELPLNVRKIIEKYLSYGNADTLPTIKALASKVKNGDDKAIESLITLLTAYLTKRDWPLPSKQDFLTVNEANELLAWTLLFGRRPNHFTISAHLLKQFDSLESFNNFVKDDLNLKLNHTGGVIKGTEKMGIKQSSTLGNPIRTEVSDNQVEVPGCFIEFVWRSKKNQGTKWQNYFTGFIANNANHVIESLYKL